MVTNEQIYEESQRVKANVNKLPFHDISFQYGGEYVRNIYEEKLRWIPVSNPPKKEELIILEYFECSNSKKYVIYDFDPEYFDGKFNVNGVANRWRLFL